MTRIEEATNKILEFIDIVKDVPKNESILAIGLDMVEWADKTMLDKVCEWLEDNIWNYIETKGLGDFEILKEVKVSEMVKDLRKVIEQ